MHCLYESVAYQGAGGAISNDSMSRAMVICRSEADRKRAANWAMKAPFGTRIVFKETKRSVPQNNLMWAMLTDIARQVEWHGSRLSADDWKLIFMDALNREARLVPSIEGDGMVNLGQSSSDLSKNEMSELIELIAAFGANHGVVFGGGQ